MRLIVGVTSSVRMGSDTCCNTERLFLIWQIYKENIFAMNHGRLRVVVAAANNDLARRFDELNRRAGGRVADKFLQLIN